jgi:hypothetical protein
MLLLTIKKAILLLMFSLHSFNVFSQYPPAQGPPPVTGNTNFGLLQVFMVNNLVDFALRDSIVPAINAGIIARNPPIGIVASHTLRPGQPYMSKTKYTDRPNVRIITIPYRVDIKLDLNGIPDRHVYLNIKVNFSCQNWFANPSGNLKVLIITEKAYLGGPSPVEQAINFFIGALTPFIDNEIKRSIPSALQKELLLNLADDRCNCLSFVLDGSAPSYEESDIKYQYNEAPIKKTLTIDNAINISVDSIKRLYGAYDRSGSILYNSVENINVELFANQKTYAFDVDQISEGQSRKLPDNNISIIKPGNTGSLVLIANITQNDGKRDSKFVVFNVAGNFGNGTQKIILTKSFLSTPFKLPNGNMSKPKNESRDAYELTITIKVYDFTKVKI